MKNEWIVIPVTGDTIVRAQEIRNQRDQQYGNIFQEESTDLRWVGEIGEICLNYWLAANCPTGFSWIMENNTAGKPDFIINGHAVGMKTVKRKVPMQPNYTAQITAKHAQEPVDYFAFACYEVPKKQLWFLGGIDKQSFLNKAQYYGAGEQVHASYTIRKGHEIYNIEISHLTPPIKWLNKLV